MAFSTNQWLELVNSYYEYDFPYPLWSPVEPLTVIAFGKQCTLSYGTNLPSLEHALLLRPELVPSTFFDNVHGFIVGNKKRKRPLARNQARSATKANNAPEKKLYQRNPN